MDQRGRAQGQPDEAAPERAGGSGGRELRGPEAPRGEGPLDPEDWGSWRWQLRHSLGSADALAAVADLTAAERRGLALAAEQGVRVAVTPYYASLIDRAHPSCPVRIQAIPAAAEFERVPGDLHDPLGEDVRRPVRALVHRYPDRALLL